MDDALDHAKEEEYDEYLFWCTAKQEDEDAKEESDEWADRRYDPLCASCRNHANDTIEAAGVELENAMTPNGLLEKNRDNADDHGEL